MYVNGVTSNVNIRTSAAYNIVLAPDDDSKDSKYVGLFEITSSRLLYWKVKKKG
jgi:hypothetical protein